MSDMGQKLSSYDEAVQDTAASAALDSGAESVKSHTSKTGLSADAPRDARPFGVIFCVCLEAKRNHGSKLM